MTKFSSIHEALLAHNIPLPGKEICSDKFTRWGKNNEHFAIRKGDGYCFGDFSINLKTFWFPHGPNSSFKNITQKTPTDMKKYKTAAKEASKLWQAANRNPHKVNEHSYLIIKRVFSYFIRQYKDKLIIPLYDIDGKLWTLQFIDPEGRKRFLKGGRKKGCFYLIGLTPSSQTIYVCEGYATGASIHMATSKPVVVAFDVGNLAPVIEQIKKCYPHARIIIAADNDLGNPENPGKNIAEKTAAQYQCNVVLPQFSETTLKKAKKLPSDFNDLHVLEGLEEVRRQVKAAGGLNHG